jgi:hypothetical protein
VVQRATRAPLLGEADLRHLQHRCHDPLRRRLVRIVQQLGQRFGMICQDRP